MTGLRSADEAREKVWDLIRDIKVSMMVTMGEDGRHFARPMMAQEHDNQGRLWFFTQLVSPKIAEIKVHPSILLSYADPSKENYVSLSGDASIITDRAEINERWSEAMKAWFPEGKDDPNIALICVEPETGEYWDSPSSTFVQVFGYVKARLTGKTIENMGENRIVYL